MQGLRRSQRLERLRRQRLELRKLEKLRRYGCVCESLEHPRGLQDAGHPCPGAMQTFIRTLIIALRQLYEDEADMVLPRPFPDPETMLDIARDDLRLIRLGILGYVAINFLRYVIFVFRTNMFYD